jgi:hypothetical protein
MNIYKIINKQNFRKSQKSIPVKVTIHSIHYSDKNYIDILALHHFATRRNQHKLSSKYLIKIAPRLQKVQVDNQKYFTM